MTPSQSAPRSAQAQPHPAQNDAPQSTTATYGGWVVQCVTPAQLPHQKVCEMAHVTQVQDKNIPFSQVVLAHPTKGQPLKLVVQAGDTDPGIAAPFARCVPGEYFAEFEIKDDYLKKLRAASGSGKVSFVDAGGHDVSFR